MARQPTITECSFDDFDERVSPRAAECDFDRVVEAAIDRRGMLGGVLAWGGIAALGAGQAPTAAGASSDRFGFAPVQATTADAVTLPEGYHAEVLVRWGDPIFPGGTEFDPASRGTAESQARAFGDNTDGMELFAKDGRLILAVNNEYTNRGVIWGNRSGSDEVTRDDIVKGMMAHGLSVVEISRSGGRWGVVRDSPYNRRVTPETEMHLTGPAAGHDLLKTAADPAGRTSLGTWNNCGSGPTPWGTYLTCEENFNGYFSSSVAGLEITPAQRRYGISENEWGYGWGRIDNRFDIAQHPNEPNRAGFVVELDPADLNATPKKRTALGRFKHENAEVVVNSDGRIVVYMGDDERGEFLYRFVSDGTYEPGRSADTLLDEGTLYAARFEEDGSGRWLALTPQSTGMASLAEICVHTRLAGSAVGATTMDRPEWVAAHPDRAEVYCALTNNKNRGRKPNAGGDATPAAGPNPRVNNRYGQIVRWRPDGGDHTAAGFEWDLYVLAGNPVVHSDANAGSANVTPDNMFNSPDALKFDSRGLLWIQTDGNDSNADGFAGQGNNQMLAGDPLTGEIRRFLVGPRECEVTGLAWAPDRRTMFVGIQHPGAKGGGNWPGGGNSVPRSAILAIEREDGGVVG